MGVLISIMIVKAGIEMLNETLDDILGHRPASELSRGIRKTVCQEPLVHGAYDLLIDDYGPDLTIASIHVEVDDVLTAAEIDALTRRLQQAVYAEHGVVLATVGIYSRNTSDDAIASMRSEITRLVMSHDDVLQLHGFFVNEESKTVTFDLIIDFANADRQQLYQHIYEDVQTAYPDYTFAITLDRDLSD